MYFKITGVLAILLEHMYKKFEINQTKIKGGCQSRRKIVTLNSKSDLPLVGLKKRDSSVAAAGKKGSDDVPKPASKKRYVQTD